jgi:DNA mismatch endonuclease (patch repair protein)
MADIVDRATRSRMMAGIRGRDTAIELYVRAALDEARINYELNVRDLPGKPDVVVSNARSVIFVHGCFWHVHGCNLTTTPGTNRTFWQSKLQGNRLRDQRTARRLRQAGWHVFTIWECRLAPATRRVVRTLMRDASMPEVVSGHGNEYSSRGGAPGGA